MKAGDWVDRVRKGGGEQLETARNFQLSYKTVLFSAFLLPMHPESD